jgi:hypothetical protein
MSAEEIARALHRVKFFYTDEKSLQRGIGQVLGKLGVQWQPEVVLTPQDRIDFLVEDGIGIEVKIDSSLAQVTRQLYRYAHQPQIKQLILVTTRSRHREQPETMNDKPLLVVYLMPSFL